MRGQSFPSKRVGAGTWLTASVTVGVAVNISEAIGGVPALTAVLVISTGITGAIVGVGATQRASAVRWGVAGNIVWAWIFTIPASAFVAAVAYWLSLVLF